MAEKRARCWRRGDSWLVAAVLAVSLLLAVYLWLSPRRGAAVEISVAGQVTERLPLNVDAQRLIAGEGGTNRLVIENGTARVVEADCPDILCVRHVPISRPGQSILCLPHRVAVTVVGDGAAIDGET